jgi:hypothetical protein
MGYLPVHAGRTTTMIPFYKDRGKGESTFRGGIQER